MRILCTTDLHGQIWPHDYTRDAPDPMVGLATASALIATARAEASNSILVDNGDILQGSALVDPEILASMNGHARPHPAIATMNALHYDAATLGNHDFNFGLEHLEQALADAKFPHVLANLVRRRGDTPLQDAPFLPPYILLDREIGSQDGVNLQIRIGIIGLAPPQISQWDHHLLQGQLETRGMVEAARVWLPVMRDAGADIVLGLCHSGPGLPDAADDAEDAGLALAALGGFDAIVLGHNHRRLPGSDFSETPGVDAAAGRINGTPAVMAGSVGKCIGLIDLDLIFDADQWHVADATCSLRQQRSETPVPDHLGAITAPAHQATREQINRELGSTDTAIHGYFPLIGPDKSLQLMADAQVWRARQLLSDVTENNLPLLSAAAPFRAGGRGGPNAFTHIAPGPIRLRHLSGLAPFPNPVCIVEATGAQVRLWLERVSALFARIAPGSEDCDLFDPGFAVYNLDVLHGLSYEVDLSRPALFDVGGAPSGQSGDGGRIRSLAHNGQPVHPDQRFLVATSSYRAAGGGGFSMVADCPVITTAPEILRKTLVDYVRAHSPLNPNAGPVWNFAPIGATAVFLGHPDAEPDSGQRVERLDALTENGFGKYRLHL